MLYVILLLRNCFLFYIKWILYIFSLCYMLFSYKMHSQLYVRSNGFFSQKFNCKDIDKMIPFIIQFGSCKLSFFPQHWNNFKLTYFKKQLGSDCVTKPFIDRRFTFEKFRRDRQAFNTLVINTSMKVADYNCRISLISLVKLYFMLIKTMPKLSDTLEVISHKYKIAVKWKRLILWNRSLYTI